MNEEEDYEDFTDFKDEEDEEDILKEEEDRSIKNKIKKLEKITLPRMTIYEKSVYIAKRTERLKENYKPLLNKKDLEELKEKGYPLPIIIANKEYELGLLQEGTKIIRDLNKYEYEEWDIKEFNFYP